MRAVELLGIQLEEQSGVPVVILREHEAPNRVLPLFVGGVEAAAIAMAIEGIVPPRPQTHDLMASLVESLEGTVERVEVTDLQEASFVAELLVHSAGGDHRVDARPSDAIALALRTGAPLYVSDAVMDEAGIIPVEVDEAAVDAEVEEFRTFLDGVDPSAFALPAGPPPIETVTATDEDPAAPE